MFQSYTYLEYFGHNPNTNEHRWRYSIVDDEFEEVAVGVGVGVGVGVWVGLGRAVAVIDTYGKRGLPVVPNLIRALQWYNSKYGYSIGQLIAWNKQYNSKFAQYEQEVEKYLVLL
jgi:hypothetical protein